MSIQRGIAQAQEICSEVTKNHLIIRIADHELEKLLKDSQATEGMVNLDVVDLGDVLTACITEAASYNDDDTAPPSPKTEEEIQAIPSFRIKDEGESCSICLVDFEVDDEAKKLECEHLFHSICLDTWLRIRGTCPLCRNEVQIVEEDTSPEEEEILPSDSWAVVVQAPAGVQEGNVASLERKFRQNLKSHTISKPGLLAILHNHSERLATLCGSNSQSRRNHFIGRDHLVKTLGGISFEICELVNSEEGPVAPLSADSISRVPIQRIVDSNPGSCAICLTSFAQNENARQLECKHLFHDDCFSAWMQIRGECPSCRSAIKRS